MDGCKKVDRNPTEAPGEEPRISLDLKPIIHRQVEGYGGRRQKSWMALGRSGSGGAKGLASWTFDTDLRSQKRAWSSDTDGCFVVSNGNSRNHFSGSLVPSQHQRYMIQKVMKGEIRGERMRASQSCTGLSTELEWSGKALGATHRWE